MIIKDSWITNIKCIVPDAYRNEAWPMYYISIPLKGDLITSRSGKTLQVKRIIHRDESYQEYTRQMRNRGEQINYTPFIELVLDQIVI